MNSSGFLKGITGILVLLFSCGEAVEKTYPVNEGIVESVYASGLIKSRGQYEVFSPSNGIVERVLVSEGDSVSENEVIIQIRNETAKLNREKARIATEYSGISENRDKLLEIRSTINQLKSKLDNDSILLERQRRLWSQEIGTRNELEQRELNYTSTAEALQAALSRYNDLEKQLQFSDDQAKKDLQISRSVENDLNVKSNINGRVYALLKEPGEMVSPQTPVAVIGGFNDFYLELQVDEYDIGNITPGARVLLSMDSYKNAVYEAVIRRIIPIMDERTRSFTVEADFVTRPDKLFPNLTAEANIILRVKDNTLTIPLDYIYRDSFVIKSNKDTVRVQIGLKDHQKAEIVNGISVDDEIIKPGE